MKIKFNSMKYTFTSIVHSSFLIGNNSLPDEVCGVPPGPSDLQVPGKLDHLDYIQR